MPAALQAVASLLPLKHAIDLARPLLMDDVPTDIALHVAVLLAYAVRRVLRRAGADAAAAAAVTERFFAPCPRGLEAALAAELAALGARVRRAGRRRRRLRRADRARVPRQPRVAAREPDPVAGRARRATANEDDALPARAGRRLEAPLRASSARCASTSRRRARRCTSLEFATLKVKDAVCDRFRADTGERPSVDKRAAGRARARAT